MAFSKEQEEWLKKTQYSPDSCKNMPEELSTKEFWLEAVRKNDRALQYVPEAWKTEAFVTVFKSAISSGSGGSGYGIELINKNVPEEWATEEFWFEAVRKNDQALQYIPESLKTEALCLAAVQKYYQAFEFVPEAMRTEAVHQAAEACCIEAMKHSEVQLFRPGSGISAFTTHPLQRVPEKLKTETVCLAAVQKDGRALTFVPEALQTEAVCLAAVQNHRGYYMEALQVVPKAKMTEAVCLALVQKNGYALEYVPEAQKTEAVCLAAVQNCDHYRNVLEYVPEALKTEEMSLIASVEFEGKKKLKDIPDAQKSEAFCLAAVQQNSGALKFVPEALKTEAFEAKIRSVLSSGSGGSGYGIELIKP